MSPTPIEAVREAELYRNLVEHGHDLVIQTGVTGRCIYASPNCKQLVGYTSEELLGQSFFKHVHPQDASGVNRHYVLGLVTHQPAHLQFRYRHKSGEWRWLETNGQPFFGAAGRWRATLVLRDITHQHQLEQQAREAQEFQNGLLASTTNAVMVLDGEGTMVLSNLRTCELSGYDVEDLQGQPWLALISEEDQPEIREALEQVFEKHLTTNRECGFRQADGGERRMNVNLAPRLIDGRVAGVIVTAEDLTELRQSETNREYLLGRLEVAQKLESIGKMSAGVAHDFNNVLQGALSTTQLLKTELTDRPDLTRLLSLQERAIERASHLTRQLLAFSRHEKIVAGPVDLCGRVRDVLDFCSTQFDDRITVENRVSPGLPQVLGDAGQVDQILLNLLLNASQALVSVANERPLRIVVNAEVTTLESDTARRHGLESGAPMVHLTIHDNGPGIPAALQAQIFDPFFTTKSPSHNHGLGLSTTHELVKNHHGIIEVESRPGYETTFHVYLPMCVEEALEPETQVVSMDEMADYDQQRHTVSA